MLICSPTPRWKNKLPIDAASFLVMGGGRRKKTDTGIQTQMLIIVMILLLKDFRYVKDRKANLAFSKGRT